MNDVTNKGTDIQRGQVTRTRELGAPSSPAPATPGSATEQGHSQDEAIRPPRRLQTWSIARAGSHGQPRAAEALEEVLGSSLCLSWLPRGLAPAPLLFWGPRPPLGAWSLFSGGGRGTSSQSRPSAAAGQTRALSISSGLWSPAPARVSDEAHGSWRTSAPPSD